MQQHQFERLVDDTLFKCREHLVLKAHEFGDQEDRLGQFKRSASLTGCTPLQVALIQAGQHFDAIANLVRDFARGESRDVEAIEQRFDELISYSLLMKALVEDAEEGAPSGRSRAETVKPVAASSTPRSGTSAIQRQAEVVVAGPGEPVLKAER